MTKVKLGGREYTLRFTLYAMDEIEATLNEQITLDKKQLESLLSDREKIVQIFVIFANQGEIAEGREPDIGIEKFKQSVGYGALFKIQAAVFQAIEEGARMETEDDEDDEVDVTLEEIKKKENRAG